MESGRILTGSTAPKVGTLEQWLKDNPSYEVIKPASLPPKSNSNSNSLSSNSMKVSHSPSVSRSPAQSVASSSSSQSNATKTPKSSLKSADTPSSSSSSKSKLSRHKSTEEKVVVADPESMRSSAKSSLKEALWHRCKDAVDVCVDEKEVERVAEEIEAALFRLFNKDVGMKYKAKYRSLIFNIKDSKNLGLFRKIVDRKITPGKCRRRMGC